MSAMRWGVPIFASALLGGCGLYIPEIQENPLDRNAGAKLVQDIALNIRCEVQDAVVHLYQRNAPIDPENRNLRWFDTWAVQLALTLTIDEKGSFNPTASWAPPGSFGLGLGGTLSADASRVDKISYFFLVSDLKKFDACPADARNRGPFILESDLKLEEWLSDTMEAADNGNTPVPAGTNGPFKSNVLSHEVKFDVVSSGNITPSWKIRQVAINGSGNFATASRDRTQDLIMTFGPADPAWTTDPVTKKKVKKSPVLSTAASNSMLASEIGNSVSTAVRNALQP
jgi:hypothetical protein